MQPRVSYHCVLINSKDCPSKLISICHLDCSDMIIGNTTVFCFCSRSKTSLALVAIYLLIYCIPPLHSNCHLVLTLTNPAIQMYKNEIPREGEVITEATAGGTEAMSALRSPALLSRAPSFRSPPATSLALLDAEALIGRGHLTALLPRNSRGGRRRRKGREAATEAVAIVALTWMEKQMLTKVRRLWCCGTRCAQGPRLGMVRDGGCQCHGKRLAAFTSTALSSERHIPGRSAERARESPWASMPY